MAKRGNRQHGSLPNQTRRQRVAALRARGLTFAEIGRRLCISRQAAWELLTKGLARHTAGVRCAACQAVITTRHLQVRTVGAVLCRSCLAARPDASFALRLWSHRLAAGLTRQELEKAAAVPVGQVKSFEERGVKPHQTTRARLAKALRTPDLERFGDEGG